MPNDVRCPTCNAEPGQPCRRHTGELFEGGRLQHTTRLIASRGQPVVEWFYVWSVKHGLWWRPKHAGYTPYINDAGTYTAEECDEIEENSQCAGRYDQVSIRIPVNRLQVVPHA